METEDENYEKYKHLLDHEYKESEQLFFSIRETKSKLANNLGQFRFYLKNKKREKINSFLPLFEIHEGKRYKEYSYSDLNTLGLVNSKIKEYLEYRDRTVDET